MFVSFDDTRLLDCGPERLVPTCPQNSGEVITLLMGTVKCTFGLDRPVEVVFGNEPTIVVFSVLDKLYQLTESGGGILDGLSEVRSVVVERLICFSLNNHTII
jgi:hypothetical protein